MNVARWTGVEVYGLRKALRDNQEAFATRISASVEAVLKWERGGPARTVSDYLAAEMDALLRGLSAGGLERYQFHLEEARKRHGISQQPPSLYQHLSAVALGLPLLRKALDRFDLPEDSPVLPLADLHSAVETTVTNQLEARYTRLILDLPELIRKSPSHVPGRLIAAERSGAVKSSW